MTRMFVGTNYDVLYSASLSVCLSVCLSCMIFHTFLKFQVGA
jgi:hypothetical protein